MTNCAHCKTTLGLRSNFCFNCGNPNLNNPQFDYSIPSKNKITSPYIPSESTIEAIKKTIFIGHPSISNSLDKLLSKYGINPLHMIFDANSHSFMSKVRFCLEISEFSKAEYICIIGDWSDVAPYYLPNPLLTYDGDEFCQSDSPYGCKNLYSEDDVLSIIPTVHVGRIPSRDINVIERALFITPQILEPHKALFFGVTDSCWTLATQTIVDSFKGVPSKVLDSVDIDFNNIPEGAVIVSPDWDEKHLNAALKKKLIQPNNLLLFNVHGGADDPTWVCEDGSTDFIEIFKPGTISDFNNSILITEACYGGALGYDEPSVVEHFFANRGLAFIGSSNIAYGSKNENLTGADLIALHFLLGLAKGMNYAKALNFAKLETLTGDPYAEDISRKTVMSFNLFGAPWHHLFQDVSQTTLEVKTSNSKITNSDSILEQIRSRNTNFRHSMDDNPTIEDLRERYRSRLPSRLVQFVINQALAIEKMRHFDDYLIIDKLINDWHKIGNNFELKSVMFKNAISYRLISKSKINTKIAILLIDSNGKIIKSMSSKGSV